MIASESRVSRLSPEQRAILALRAAKKLRSTVTDEKEPPKLCAADPANRHVPFSLTDLQQAYWVGRNEVFGMGKIATHIYMEVDGAGLELPRLEEELRKIIERHDMLRAIVLESGQQQVLKEVPEYRIKTLDLRDQPEETVSTTLRELRFGMSHQVLPSNQWPLFEIRATRFAPDNVRLHCSFDGLILDGWSVFLFFREWSRLCRSPNSTLRPLEIAFRDYVTAEAASQTTPEYDASRTYWRKRAATLPPAPDLPLAKDPASLKSPRFIRRIVRMEEPLWSRLKMRATEAGLTHPGLLAAAYSEVLSLWSKNRKFTINVPRFNRAPLHPQVDDILGEFASFTLLEIDHTFQGSFLERARRLQEQLWADLDHSRFSGIQVLRELALQQGTVAGVTMPVVFTCFPQDKDKNASLITAPGDLGSVVYSISQSSQVWLDNHVYEQNGDLVCDWDSIEELFPERLSQDMLAAFFRLLRALATHEDLWHRNAVELRQAILPESSDHTRKNFKSAPIPNVLAHELFFEQARNHPERVALVDSEKSWSYRDLYERSAQLGRTVREMGAGPNTLVAVVMEKGWEQIVGVLSILQSGAAYLPIDPELPSERIRYLLQHSEVRIALTQSRLAEKIGWLDGIQRISVDEERWFSGETGPLDQVQKPDDLMYVLYTSGSTGLPKGVMIAHRGVVNALVQTNASFGVTGADRVLALTALHHDMSVFDIFGVLAAGGTIVMPQASGRRDPAHWADLMKKHQVTLWNSVPAMLEMFVEYAQTHPEATPSALRLAFSGGDWIPVTLPDRLKQCAPNAKLVSVGGPTETTLWNIWHPVEAADSGRASIPYGRPIANTKYYILNEGLEECPTWVTGELCCAGTGVARGYWRDDEKTRSKFIQHPVTGERIYRTGDLGRYLPDGNIEFMGRVDFQVKIQGQRIELGEIESVIQQHPIVRSVVVSAAGEKGKKRLVAHVVLKDPKEKLNGQLKAYLREKLPEHMIPASLIQLESLPLTPNGKIDRRALPEMATPSVQAELPSANENDLQGRISRLICEILRIKQIDPAASILNYGANSIDMVKIGNQLEKMFGKRPRMDQLFRLQSASAIAGFYAEALPKRPAPSVTKAQESRYGSQVRSILSGYKILLDPSDREAFKKTQPGLRRDLEESQFVELRKPEATDELVRAYRRRRSYRKFSLKPIALDGFSQWLSCLSEMTIDDKPEYLYASPGGLYPGQIYIHVKPGRIEGLGGGTYYYHPVHHRLISLTPEVEIDRSIHVPFINAPTFDESAFSLFFIASLDAIGPSYGEESLHFLTLETGIMAHLLESRSPDYGIGICQIGDIDFSAIRPWFKLNDTHVMIHSLVGGLINQGASVETAETSGQKKDVNEKINSIFNRIKELSKEEVRSLLSANKKAPL